MIAGGQFSNLLLLAIPVACVSWTFTHEDIFREPHEYFVRRSEESKWMLKRKFFYLLTCEYCFSHYITIGALFLTHFHMLFQDWRGYLVSGFSLVWVANIYMSLFALIRVDLRKERMELKEKEKNLKS